MDQSNDENTQTNVKLGVELESNNTNNKISIYDLNTKNQRMKLLLVASIACLQMPFSDTIYLPALTAIGDDFKTTQGIVALSVALFMFFVGISSLVCGPASDYYGRRKILWLVTALYIVMDIICMFAPSIVILIVFRALQGCCVSGFLVVGAAIVADIFPLSERGTATGIFTIPLLIGPVLGPIIGGFLSQSKGWRSTFLLLIVLSVIVAFGMLIFLKETHQYFVLQHVAKTDEKKAKSIVEYDEITATPPRFINPWSAVKLSFDPNFSPFIAVSAMQFGVFYCSMTLFSPIMTAPPYNYSEGIVGLLYIPIGVGALLAAVTGGKLSDISGNKYKAPEARMLYTIILSLVIMPIGVLIYGWCVYYKTNLAGILVGQFILGFGNSVFLPSILSYLSGLKQSIAAATSAALQLWNFIAAGVATEVTVYIVDAIGLGPLSVILTGVLMIAQIIALVIIIRKMTTKRR